MAYKFKLTAVSLMPQGLISLGEVLELEPSNQANGDDSDTGSHSDTPSQSQHGMNGLSQAPSLRRSSLHSHSGTLPVIHSFGEEGLWEPGSPADDHRLVYQHGKPCDVYTLILQGRVLVRTGATVPHLPLVPILPSCLSHLFNACILRPLQSLSALCTSILEMSLHQACCISRDGVSSAQMTFM